MSTQPRYQSAQTNEVTQMTRRWPAMVSADEQHVVLPQHALTQLPMPLQNQLASLLDHVQQALASASWLTYRVVPSRWARIDELDEPGLREAGVITDLDSEGELVYRTIATGHTLSDEQLAQPVLVSCEHAGSAVPDHAP